MRHLITAFALLTSTFLHTGCTQKDPSSTCDSPPANATTEWIPIFNGENLDGWTPKFTGFPLGENFANTYRVEEGILKVVFDKNAYGEHYQDRFGHLYYNTPYSHYRLRLEYKFNGDKYPGAPGWNLFNSGVMVHGQDPKTLGLHQGFPASIEMQFLADIEQEKRTNLNICTPATHVVIDNKLIKQHVITADNPAPPADQWQQVEILVQGNELLEHYQNGKCVLSYSQPQYDLSDSKWIDPNDPNTQQFIQWLGDKRQIIGGSISLQAEGHQIDFRRIELLPLDGNNCAYQVK